MGREHQRLRWGIERRLEFVEFRLYWEGGVNRSDIVSEFDVSVPQASKDLTLYQEQAPENIRYDRSLKRYFATENFKPKFIKLDADAYLRHLTDVKCEPAGVGLSQVEADRLQVPHRRIRPDVLRSVLTAARSEQSIEIYYQSMSTTKTEPMWRRISPHAFGSDGLRWHVRAFCHVDEKFKDFIVSRCLKVRSAQPTSARPEDDRFWGRYFSIILRPNPRLTTGQQEIIAEDFGMQGSEVAVPVRQAMLYYFSKRLRLDVAEEFDDPREAPVVIKNRAAFDAALSEAMS